MAGVEDDEFGGERTPDEGGEKAGCAGVAAGVGGPDEAGDGGVVTHILNLFSLEGLNDDAARHTCGILSPRALPQCAQGWIVV